MIKVTIGTNTSRKEIIAEGTKTIKELLNENNVQYTGTTIHLDGMALTTTEVNMTLEQLNVKDECFIIAVIKADNA